MLGHMESMLPNILLIQKNKKINYFHEVHGLKIRLHIMILIEIIT